MGKPVGLIVNEALQWITKLISYKHFFKVFSLSAQMQKLKEEIVGTQMMARRKTERTGSRTSRSKNPKYFNPLKRKL